MESFQAAQDTRYSGRRVSLAREVCDTRRFSNATSQPRGLLGGGRGTGFGIGFGLGAPPAPGSLAGFGRECLVVETVRAVSGVWKG